MQGVRRDNKGHRDGQATRAVLPVVREEDDGMKNWDTETADTCRLPELIPDICKRCRDYDYCHRQLTLSDMLKGTQEDTNAQNHN